MSLARDTAVFGSQAPNRKNLLINAGFDIWERGTSFTGVSTSDYRCDRWRVGTNGNLDVGKVYFTNTDDRGNSYKDKSGCRIEINSPGTALDFRQRIETRNDWYGKTLTLSYLLRQTTGSGVSIGIRVRHWDTGGLQDDLTILSDAAISTTFIWEEVTFDMPAYTGTDDAPLYTDVYFIFDYVSGAPVATDIFDFVACQLEFGAEATAFEERFVAEELALCQRYFTQVISVGYGVGYAASTTSIRSFIPTAVPMRGVPDIAVRSPGALSNMALVGNGSVLTPTAVGSISNKGTGVQVYWTVSGAVLNHPYVVVGQAYHLDIDAEL